MILREENNNLEAFINSYLTCALWSSTYGEDMQSIDEDYSIEDIAPKTLEIMQKDCANFWEQFRDQILNAKTRNPENNAGRAGHDFWLTRNRHGAGFWDGDWPKELGEELTKAAHIEGSFDLDVWDNQVHYIGA